MSGDYSLPDVLERIYDNQLALEAAVMELTLWVEQRASPEVGDNIRGALECYWGKRWPHQTGLGQAQGHEYRLGISFKRRLQNRPR